MSIVTPDGFRKIRESIGYSQARLAKKMDITIRTITRWETGEVPIPKTVELALEHIALKAKRNGRKR